MIFIMFYIFILNGNIFETHCTVGIKQYFLIISISNSFIFSPLDTLPLFSFSLFKVTSLCFPFPSYSYLLLSSSHLHFSSLYPSYFLFPYPLLSSLLSISSFISCLFPASFLIAYSYCVGQGIALILCGCGFDGRCLECCFYGCGFTLIVYRTGFIQNRSTCFTVRNILGL